MVSSTDFLVVSASSEINWITSWVATASSSDFLDASEVPAETFVLEGRATKDIVKFAEKNDSDLVVIATHGLTGIEHFLIGSVTQKVVRRAPCPVFTVKTYGKSLV